MKNKKLNPISNFLQWSKDMVESAVPYVFPPFTHIKFNPIVTKTWRGTSLKFGAKNGRSYFYLRMTVLSGWSDRHLELGLIENSIGIRNLGSDNCSAHLTIPIEKIPPLIEK